MVTREKERKIRWKNVSLSTGCAFFQKQKSMHNVCAMLCTSTSTMWLMLSRYWCGGDGDVDGHRWNSRKKIIMLTVRVIVGALLYIYQAYKLFYRSNILLGIMIVCISEFGDTLSCVINFQSSYLFDNLFTVSVEIFLTNVTPFKRNKIKIARYVEDTVRLTIFQHH